MVEVASVGACSCSQLLFVIDESSPLRTVPLVSWLAPLLKVQHIHQGIDVIPQRSDPLSFLASNNELRSPSLEL